jgi:hypothetical protein
MYSWGLKTPNAAGQLCYILDISIVVIQPGMPSKFTRPVELCDGFLGITYDT